MEIGANTDTAVQGGTFLTALTALLKSFYGDWQRTKREDRQQAKFEAVETRLRGHDEEIKAHALYDTKAYVPRDEFAVVIARLDAKLDAKFDILNSNIITAIRDGSGRKTD